MTSIHSETYQADKTNTHELYIKQEVVALLDLLNVSLNNTERNDEINMQNKRSINTFQIGYIYRYTVFICYKK